MQQLDEERLPETVAPHDPERMLFSFLRQLDAAVRGVPEESLIRKLFDHIGDGGGRNREPPCKRGGCYSFLRRLQFVDVLQIVFNV